VGTYDHQSGDCHRPSATRIEFCKVEVYLNIFAREEQEDFTCRVICTDGEKTGHANPYEEWRARV